MRLIFYEKYGNYFRELLVVVIVIDRIQEGTDDA